MLCRVCRLHRGHTGDSEARRKDMGGWLHPPALEMTHPGASAKEVSAGFPKAQVTGERFLLLIVGKLSSPYDHSLC